MLRFQSSRLTSWHWSICIRKRTTPTADQFTPSKQRIWQISTQEAKHCLVTTRKIPKESKQLRHLAQHKMLLVISGSLMKWKAAFERRRKKATSKRQLPSMFVSFYPTCFITHSWSSSPFFSSNSIIFSWRKKCLVTIVIAMRSIYNFISWCRGKKLRLLRSHVKE